MKELLKIKRRESFRPFAPSVLDKHVAEWFEEDDDVPLMQVFQIRAENDRSSPRSLMWTVRAACKRYPNAPIRSIIDSFRELTGVPMVLNTSFNENEPVVCEPRQALDRLSAHQDDCVSYGSSSVASRGFEANCSMIGNGTLVYLTEPAEGQVRPLRVQIAPMGH
jgi:carbamoyltransferase